MDFLLFIYIYYFSTCFCAWFCVCVWGGLQSCIFFSGTILGYSQKHLMYVYIEGVYPSAQTYHIAYPMRMHCNDLLSAVERCASLHRISWKDVLLLSMCMCNSAKICHKVTHRFYTTLVMWTEMSDLCDYWPAMKRFAVSSVGGFHVLVCNTLYTWSDIYSLLVIQVPNLYYAPSIGFTPDR